MWQIYSTRLTLLTLLYLYVPWNICFPCLLYNIKHDTVHANRHTMRTNRCWLNRSVTASESTWGQERTDFCWFTSKPRSDIKQSLYLPRFIQKYTKIQNIPQDVKSARQSVTLRWRLKCQFTLQLEMKLKKQLFFQRCRMFHRLDVTPSDFCLMVDHVCGIQWIWDQVFCTSLRMRVLFPI